MSVASHAESIIVLKDWRDLYTVNNTEDCYVLVSLVFSGPSLVLNKECIAGSI